MKRLIATGVLFIAFGVAMSALAQQPQQREPTASEVMAAMEAVKGQRDFAQGQAANANAAAQQIGERLQAAQKELADLKAKCGDRCEPEKKEAVK